MKFTIEGNDCMPPISGGYLLVYRGTKELGVISVPSPNYTADRYRDSVSGNHDVFEDDEGNEFNIDVWSSNVGVDWEISVKTDNENLANEVKVEYYANEF